MPKPQSVVFGTPYTDQMYSAVTHSWNQITPRPAAWMGEISAYLPEAHNRLVQRFLEHTDADRLVIIEDDLRLDHRIAARCATHRADIVSGLYRARRPPHNAILYESLDETGGGHYFSAEKVLEMVQHPGEHPIAGCGTGIISIRRGVLEAMAWPWFEPSPGDRANEERPGFGGHDLYFCAKASRAGASITFDSHPIMWGIHVGWREIAPDTYIP